MFKKIILIILIILITVSAIYFGFSYFSAQKELNQVKLELKTQQTNAKILAFTQFFIANVLNASAEVDFDTRLKLENMVRDINNEEIFNEWQKFISSKTETEAQAEVKILLKLLINNIKN